MNKKEKMEKLKNITNMLNKTFHFGCSDEAWDKYSQAVYYK